MGLSPQGVEIHQGVRDGPVYVSPRKMRPTSKATAALVPKEHSLPAVTAHEQTALPQACSRGVCMWEDIGTMSTYTKLYVSTETLVPRPLYT